MAVAWEDRALVLSVRRFGEHDSIVSLFTAEHGRAAGLVKGGAGRQHRAVLQPGNMVKAWWRARLEDQLGTLTCEPAQSYAALALADAPRLAALSAVCAMLDSALPEREAHAPLFAATLDLIARYSVERGAADYARWELLLLSEMGFGLDLTACAVNGDTGNLAYVSPKSGRAVSVAGAGSYAPRLFALPAFLHQHDAPAAQAADIGAALALTGHFFATHVFAPHGRDLPAARQRFAARFK
ncbi:MAG: DNA repair protein RecO [Rhodospirillaceae bacterium]|nr:DNA repair protein RecO [Rhodospirillaceae bacterium]